MLEKDKKEDPAKTTGEPLIAEDDVYFFNPWDEEFKKDMSKDNAQFEF